MTCAALIAIKSTPSAKSRLRHFLPDALHAELVDAMLRHVIAAAVGARRIEEVTLVSPDVRATPPWPRTLPDIATDLNAAFELGIRDAAGRGHDSVLLLPADLARIDAATLDDFIRIGQATGVAIAVDRSGTGTNALWFELQRRIPLAFGAGSCAAHRASCEHAGLAAALVQDAKLSLDIDTVEDLRQLHADDSYRFLHSLERSVA